MEDLAPQVDRWLSVLIPAAQVVLIIVVALLL